MVSEMPPEMPIVFDPAKDEANRAKHGLSLTFVGPVLKGRVFSRLDDRFDYGEDRFVTFGWVSGRLYVAAGLFTWLR
ncbi:BrnT family toxin [uncultured Rhodospira sp.]|uniref:BrnT family toxin n=1 Tax=uncultured Rhodospira sp. TaxID=1936189 RepID=UPI003457B30F